MEPLFAVEASDGSIAIIVTLSGMVGAAGVWVANWLSGRHDKRRAEKKEDEKTIVDHLKEVEERCNQENRELKLDIKHTNKRLLAVMNHLMYLEGILESKGIRFRRMDMSAEESMNDESVVVPHGPIKGVSTAIPEIPRSSPRLSQESDSGENI